MDERVLVMTKDFSERFQSSTISIHTTNVSIYFNGMTDIV